MKALAARTGRISTSKTVAIDAKYKKLKAEGKDVLSLGAGELDLDTPDLARDAAIDSIRRGLTRYGAVTGLPELKEAISRKLAGENSLLYPAAQIVVSAGTKQCVFNTLLALVDEGDEVLIPTPSWGTYWELVSLLGGVPVPIATNPASGFKVSAAMLDAAVSERSKLLILNSPGNPTGAVYGRSELEELAAIIVSRDLYCLSDEIYERITFGDHHHVSIASLGPEVFARTVTVNGMSKAFAMSGWRIGYLAAPPELAASIGAIQSHAAHHPANASQYAALACLESGGGFIERMRAHLRECRELALERLRSIPGLEITPPQGAFYVFFGVGAHLGKYHDGRKIETSFDLSNHFLDTQLLATMPGGCFGAEGYLRVSFANSLENLRAAFERLAKGFAALG